MHTNDHSNDFILIFAVDKVRCTVVTNNKHFPQNILHENVLYLKFY